jgi:hypothetical protein
VTSQDAKRQHTNILASVHHELLQRSQAMQEARQGTRSSHALQESHLQPEVSASAERRIKKRHFLKERFQGNPHLSVEASALQERREQLRPVSERHPMQATHPKQLQDLPAAGQVLTSITDLLKKVSQAVGW